MKKVLLSIFAFILLFSLASCGNDEKTIVVGATPSPHAEILNSDAVQDYLNDVIKVPSSYEKVKNRFISSDNGKLNKQSGFAESYIKTIFGVK